jgi:hypothetical protein
LTRKQRISDLSVVNKREHSERLHKVIEGDERMRRSDNLFVRVMEVIEDEREKRRLRLTLYSTITLQLTRHHRPDYRPDHRLTDQQGRLSYYYLGSTYVSQLMASGVEETEPVSRKT